jgi:starch phosphorylase
LDLYNILEEEVVPLYYQIGHDGIPRGWVEKMKAGLQHLVPIFNSHRMVQEYSYYYYLPCSKRFNYLCENNFQGANELASWRQKLFTEWQGVSVEKVISDDGLDRAVGDSLKIKANVRLGALSPDDVTVDAYYGRLDHNGEFIERETVTLDAKDFSDGVHVFQGEVPCIKPGRFGYTVRVTPSLKKLEKRFVMGLVTWA